MSRIILHCDMNNFYASVECMLDMSLRGHPVAVGGDVENRHGITPATVRLKDDNRFELVSGHRRKRACELAGMDTLRCEVVDLSRDEATILMVESNYQRSQILPSEKAFAYKMRLEAMKRQQGQRTDLTSVPVGQKLENKTTRELIAAESGDSNTQIQRYVRLTNLVPELLECVDDGRMKMRPAVELSYLDEDCQRDIVDEIDLNESTPSHDQTIRMRKAFEENRLTIFVTGKVYNSTVNDFLERQCKKAKVPVISVHGLRHTHASLLLFTGVSIASVARRLGHASMTTTQKTYLHIIQELENKDVDLVMRSLSGLS